MSETKQSSYERLSPLERERVDWESNKTLHETFAAAHSAVGWSGDVMSECWQAGLPIMKEAIADVTLRHRTPAPDAVREALFLPIESDAGHNLDGALYDLREFQNRRLPPDDVCIRTIERVVLQIDRARAALSPKPAEGRE